MFVFFSILIIIACVMLTLVVLIQNPKGGGIASNFSSPTQIMGARRSNDVIEKATWILAVVLISFSLISNFFRPFGQTETTGAGESRLKQNIENAEAPVQQQPAAPVQEQPTQEAAPAGDASTPVEGATTPETK